MTRVEWSRVRPLLSRLWELPEEEHEAFLEDACAGDEQLARRVRRMFLEERDEHSFLESPLAWPARVEAGARLGPYRLLRELGSGGMGAVWLAERADQSYQKRVAVKVLKQGLHSDDVLQRFRHERQVLAWLDHPGIARLVDGGRTEHGLPYLVMEYVDGTPIDRFCDGRQMTIEERLKLFLGVCDAVQHAHERGVVHRDLKPSNVLVDGDGRVRLLDFGIAKVLGAESEEEQFELTRTGQRLYSPHYAPPEQVRGEAVTAASDVYALGVLLFELLTGRRPYHVRSLSQFELERVVCEGEPERPSTSTGTRVLDEQQAQPWGARGLADERSLRRRLAGDLDWILLVCLRKEPERRYANGAALAADLRRHLAGQPVQARPDSAAYRASRFVRRNRTLVASFVAVLGIVVAALVVVLALLAQARRAEERRGLEAYSAGLQVAEGAIRANDLGQAQAALERAPRELRGWEWRHLMRRLDRSRASLETRAYQPLDRVDADATAGFALVSTAGVEIADPARGEVRRLAPTDALESRLDGGTPHASFHPDGGVLVAAMHDHRARVLDASSLEVLHEVRFEAVRGAEFSPRGERIALVLAGGEAVLLAWPSLAEVAHWPTEVDRPYYARFSPDGNLLAFAGWDEVVRVWRVQGDEPRAEAVLGGHTMEIRSVAWAPEGRQLATASLDRTVRVWDLGTPEPISRVFREHGAGLVAVLFHPRDGSIFSRDANGEVLRWDPESGAIRNRIRALGPGAMGVSADGNRIAVNEFLPGRGSRLRTWPADSQDVLTLQACEFANAVAFSPDGTLLFCSSPDGFVRRWDRAGRELPRLGLDRVPLRMCPNLEGGSLLVRHEDGRLTRWDLDGNHLGTLEQELRPQEYSRIDIHGSRAALCGRGEHGGRVVVMNVEDGAVLAEADFEGTDATIVLWEHAGDALLVVTGSALWTWRPFDGSAPRSLADLSDGAHRVALEPGGRRLLVAQTSARLFLVDTRNGTVDEVAGPGTPCMSVAWSPGEPRFAVGYSDGSLGIWDAKRLHQVVRLRGHQGPVRSLAFSPSGERLASCADDGLVKVWDAPAVR